MLHYSLPVPQHTPTAPHTSHLFFAKEVYDQIKIEFGLIILNLVTII